MDALNTSKKARIAHLSWDGPPQPAFRLIVGFANGHSRVYQ